MEISISTTFNVSRAALDSISARVAADAALRFYENPKNPGFQFHRVERARDPNFWSARVNDDIRMIIHQSEGNYTICYVDRHDAAYRWAQNRILQPHEVTGALQFVEIPQVEADLDSHQTRPVRDGHALTAPEAGAEKVFRRLTDADLLAHGVPRLHLDLVREATENEFCDRLIDILPEEAAEALLHYLTEGELPRPVPPTAEIRRNPLAHRDAKRRFKVVESEEELARILEGNWEAWRVFLHPAQQEVVDRCYSGPARVTGAAGTGKTVVALHRAVRTVQQDPNAKVLLTTFSRALSARLRRGLNVLLGENSQLLDRIAVIHLHGLAANTWSQVNNLKFQLSVGPDREALMRNVLKNLGADEEGIGTVLAEWNAIVNDEGIATWDEYRVARRAGRGRAYNLSQRQQMWRLLEVLSNELRATGKLTPEQASYFAAQHVTESGSPFTHVIADEVQDFGPAELRFLNALAGEGRQLFLTGDIGQRIYKGKTSFRSAGIDLRGRSARLTVNYRTTQQIRGFADSFMPNRLEDIDIEDADERASVSLLQGAKPRVAATTSTAKELQVASEWIQVLISRGYKPADIAILARTKRLLDERAVPIIRKLGLKEHYLSEAEPPQDKHIPITTMHNAKGLEFKAVLLIGVEDRYIPNKFVLGQKDDEADKAAFIEQERNLLYVACTRAREHLLITTAGQRSRFLGQISNQIALVTGAGR